MPAEKKDGRTAAGSASVGSPKIFFLQRCSPDLQAPLDQLLALSQGQNPVGRLLAYSQERTSGCAIQSVCWSSSPDQKPALDSQVFAGALAAAALPSMWGGCRAADPKGSGPALRSQGEYCLT